MPFSKAELSPCQKSTQEAPVVPHCLQSEVKPAWPGIQDSPQLNLNFLSQCLFPVSS